jgi:exopolyphosphatase / guanosine-5'-triphosphate,3'-diphosphate pyrophosphatase
MRTAIIDMGTNTFNLLVAKTENGKTEVIHNSRIAVKIGEGGINQGEIIPEAMDRALAALVKLTTKAKELEAGKIIALATSAVRTATNQKDFLERIKVETGLDVTVISGSEEARLICQGVRQVVPMENRKVMILDIGGGSNELIIADQHSIYWKHSFPLGMSRLLERFGPTNPTDVQYLASIEFYLAEQLEGLREAVNTWKPESLIGASGAFESVALMLQYMPGHAATGCLPDWQDINMEEYKALYYKLLHTTLEERYNMPGLEPMRADMIVLSCIFISFVLKLSGITQLEYSDFALKEGMLHEFVTAKHCEK